MSTLIASAGNLKSLEKLINDYFYSNGYVIDEETFVVRNVRTNKVLEHFQVTKKGKRFRFEML